MPQADVRFQSGPTILDEMRRPTRASNRGPILGSDNDGGQRELAVSLLQGCVQLHEAVQSSYPVMR